MPSKRHVVIVGAVAVAFCLLATVLSLVSGSGLPVVPLVVGSISLLVVATRLRLDETKPRRPREDPPRPTAQQEESAGPAGRFSGPAFAGPDARHAEVDALPFTPAERRKVWWQITIAGVLLAAASIGLIVYGVLYDDGPSLGFSVLTVIGAAVALYASVFRRRDRTAPHD